MHVYLLYLDESGSLDDPHDHFAVGGVAVHESDIPALTAAADALLEKRLEPHLRSLELHATKIRTGGGAWRGIPRQVRDGILGEAAQLLGSYTSPSQHLFRLFAVVRSPDAVSHADPLERTFEELLLRFDSMLRRYGTGPDLGLVVADKSKYEGVLQPIVRGWRDRGTRFRPLKRLAEVPLFTDSRATRLIQLADVVAYAAYQNYKKSIDRWLTPMLPRFDASGGKLHGLVHLTNNHSTCGCKPCLSRREL